MKKRLAMYGAIGMLVYAGVLGYLYFCDGVTKANYLRIKREMTKSEIRWLLGGPFAVPDRIEQVGNGTIRETWLGHNGGMVIHFDEHDQIIWKEWNDSLYRETVLRVFLDGGKIRE